MDRRTVTLALVCALGALVLRDPPALTAPQARASAEAREARVIVDRIAVYQRVTWHWQHVIGLRHTPSMHSASSSSDLAYRRWVLKLWRRRAANVLERAQNPPHEPQWRCIHRYEASWHADTGNGYYGGLQMDIGFQRHYGAYLLRKKGTADHWSPFEQMWVAERAHRSGRGFYPWPNTARACGLI